MVATEGRYTRVRGLDTAGARADDSTHEDTIHALVRRAAAGDREALAGIYAQYSTRVFHVVNRILQDPHEAEDVTQQVFLKLMYVLPSYERRKVPFSAWLLRVARNAALDTERKLRSVHCEADVTADGQDDGDHERNRSLRVALQALPPAQRDVVILRHLVGLSAPEIAHRLGKTAGSIHALDQRGRRSMQSDLARLGSAPVTQASGRPRLQAVA